MLPMQKFKVVTEDKTYSLVIKRPSPDEIDEADRIYGAKIADLVRDKKHKLLLRDELEGYLRENGIWTEKDEDRITTLYKEIKECLNQLKKGGKKLSEGRAIALKITEKRMDVMRAYQKRQIFDDATIESVATREKNEYLHWAAVVDSETGAKQWENVEAMRQDKDSPIYQESLPVFTKLLYGYDEEVEKSLPENLWLKKYSFVNDKLQLTDRKSGAFVDREGRPLEERKKEIQADLDIFSGDIKEEEPFLEDDTNEPATTLVKEIKQTEQTEQDKKDEKGAEAVGVEAAAAG